MTEEEDKRIFQIIELQLLRKITHFSDPVMNKDTTLSLHKEGLEERTCHGDPVRIYEHEDGSVKTDPPLTQIKKEINQMIEEYNSTEPFETGNVTVETHTQKMAAMIEQCQKLKIAHLEDKWHMLKPCLDTLTDLFEQTSEPLYKNYNEIQEKVKETRRIIKEADEIKDAKDIQHTTEELRELLYKELGV